MTDKTNEITWEYGSYGPYISAESFVRIWQTSNSVVDFQRKVVKQLHEDGRFERKLEWSKDVLSEYVSRLCAIRQKDLESPLLEEKDIAALKGTKIQPYSWSEPETVDLADHIEYLEGVIRRYKSLATQYQGMMDDPERSSGWGGVDIIPGAQTLQSRAKRYRDKGVSLKYLTYDDEPPQRCKWEILSELADELAA